MTAPDVLGFGSSASLDEPFGISDYCGWLDDFMHAAKLNRPHILAHSFGARMAIAYLSENPEGAQKLIITGGAGIVKPRSKQYMRRVKTYRRIKKIFPKFAEKHFGSAEYRTLSPLMRESYKKIVNEDLSECAKKIKNSTLLIYGGDDKTTPADEEGKIFNSLIPCSRLEIMRGGHFCFSQYPDEFNALLGEFLNRR